MTTTLSRAARCDVLDQMLKENRVIRHRWRDEVNGKERLCLYMALIPECNESTQACPADVMPQWLAECVPWLDDNGSAEAWLPMVQRFSAVIRRAGVLSLEAWETIQYRWMRDILAEALSSVSTDEWGVRTAITQVDALFVRVLNGESVVASEWSTAERSAESAARSAAWSAARSAAWSAARSAAWSAAWSAVRSAASAAWSAARSAESAASAASAERSAESAAWSAVDRLTVKLLDHIDAACGESK